MWDPSQAGKKEKWKRKEAPHLPTHPVHLPCGSIHIRVCEDHCHSTCDAAQDARDAVQVVNTTCVLDTQPGLQEWLGWREWSGRAEAGSQDLPSPVSPGAPHPPGPLQPQPTAWAPHREEHEAQGGDEAAEEAHNEGTVGREHHFGGGAHAHPSSQRGILDVHLGVGRVGTLGPPPKTPASVHSWCKGGPAVPGTQGWLRVCVMSRGGGVSVTCLSPSWVLWITCVPSPAHPTHTGPHHALAGPGLLPHLLLCMWL